MMIALPLLERYLRQKVRLPLQGNLSPSFYDELIRLFPEIGDRAAAKHFWQVYRNGLLHEVSMSLQDRAGNQTPGGSLSHDTPGITRRPAGAFNVHPVDFANRVTQTIENDFATFESATSATSLPTVTAETPGGAGSSAILSTSSSR